MSAPCESFTKPAPVPGFTGDRLPAPVVGIGACRKSIPPSGSGAPFGSCRQEASFVNLKSGASDDAAPGRHGLDDGRDGPGRPPSPGPRRSRDRGSVEIPKERAPVTEQSYVTLRTRPAHLTLERTCSGALSPLSWQPSSSPAW